MEFSNCSESWDWHGDGYYEPKDLNLEMSECVWNGNIRNGEEFSYMVQDTTPVKACGDFSHHVNNCGSMNKISVECRENSSVKRRRMLEFTDELIDPSFCSEDSSFTFLKSKERIDVVEEVLSQLETTFQDDTSLTNSEGQDESDHWFADCLIDTDMLFSSEDGNASGISDVQTDNTELSNVQRDSKANVVPRRTVRTSKNVIFRGRKSYIQTPPKLASSIAYPFTFIKPCEARGDVTLKDINQRIRNPPPSKSYLENEDPVVCYPASAFSGKPVVGKTRIRTEGGKGSITIMKTKG